MQLLAIAQLHRIHMWMVVLVYYDSNMTALCSIHSYSTLSFLSHRGNHICLQGVLAMSWSGHDAGLLLSSGKDNRTILWDTASGEMLGEMPGADSWNFDVVWSPTNPGVFATSSYGAAEGEGGKVTLTDCCKALMCISHQ